MNTISRTLGLKGYLLDVMTSFFTFVAPARTGSVESNAATHGGDTRSDAVTSAHAAELFVQALCDDSNYELDWLWLASHVVRDHERRYCLQRALHINPDSWVAKQELAKLPTLPAYIQHLTGQAA